MLFVKLEVKSYVKLRMQGVDKEMYIQYTELTRAVKN